MLMEAETIETMEGACNTCDYCSLLLFTKSSER